MIQVMTCVSAEQHPNADRLRLYTFNNGAEDFQIVANFTNVYQVGDRAAIARTGTVLPAEFGDGKSTLTIVERKVRGSLSQGMALGPTNAGIGEDVSIAYGATEAPS